MGPGAESPAEIETDSRHQTVLSTNTFFNSSCSLLAYAEAKAGYSAAVNVKGKAFNHYLDSSGKLSRCLVWPSIKFMIMMQKCRDNQNTRSIGREWDFKDIKAHHINVENIAFKLNGNIPVYFQRRNVKNISLLQVGFR